MHAIQSPRLTKLIRHLDMTNAASLKTVKDTVVDISAEMESKANIVESRLCSISSSISSSTNSLRAQNSEVSDKIDTLTGLLRQIILPQNKPSDLKSRYTPSATYIDGANEEFP